MNGHSIIGLMADIARILDVEPKRYLQICLVTYRQEKESEGNYGKRNSYS